MATVDNLEAALRAEGALIREAQSEITLYLAKEIEAPELVNRLIALFDGPEQRAAARGRCPRRRPPMPKCRRCQDARWVCENHPHKPWGRKEDKCCGGAGMPCPHCNISHDGERPAMSADFIPALDGNKGPVH